MARETQFCTFYVGGLFLGIEVTCIQEVIREQPLTMVPLAPPMVAGLMNLRGHIVPALDLRQRLSLPPRAPGERKLNVVVRSGDGAVSLLVDEVGDVVVVDDAAFELPPDTLDRGARWLIRGAYKLEGRLLLVLDATRSVETSDGDN